MVKEVSSTECRATRRAPFFFEGERPPCTPPAVSDGRSRRAGAWCASATTAVPVSAAAPSGEPSGTDVDKYVSPTDIALPRPVREHGAPAPPSAEALGGARSASCEEPSADAKDSACDGDGLLGVSAVAENELFGSLSLRPSTCACRWEGGNINGKVWPVRYCDSRYATCADAACLGHQPCNATLAIRTRRRNVQRTLWRTRAVHEPASGVLPGSAGVSTVLLSESVCALCASEAAWLVDTPSAAHDRLARALPRRVRASHKRNRTMGSVLDGACMRMLHPFLL
jgi:hypothetical protein